MPLLQTALTTVSLMVAIRELLSHGRKDYLKYRQWREHHKAKRAVSDLLYQSQEEGQKAYDNYVKRLGAPFARGDGMNISFTLSQSMIALFAALASLTSEVEICCQALNWERRELQHVFSPLQEAVEKRQGRPNDPEWHLERAAARHRVRVISILGQQFQRMLAAAPTMPFPPVREVLFVDVERRCHRCEERFREKLEIGPEIGWELDHVDSVAAGPRRPLCWECWGDLTSATRRRKTYVCG